MLFFYKDGLNITQPMKVDKEHEMILAVINNIEKI